MILIGLNSGLLGSFVLWKRLSNLSDSISHFSVLGAALGFLLGCNLNFTILCASVFYIMLLYFMRRKFPNDLLVALCANIGLACAILLSAFFTNIRIDFIALLFGDILVINYYDLLIMFLLTISMASVVVLYWKDLLLTILNADLARAKNIKTNFLDFFIVLVIVLYITIAVKIIGAILLSSMLIIPAAGASLIAKSPSKMVVYSVMISLISQLAGLCFSMKYDLAIGGAGAICSFIILCFIMIILELRKLYA